MPRCYFQLSKSVLSIQLHSFSDASKAAYAGVVYVRAVYQDGTVSVRLMLAKLRIALLKEITIPQLELQCMRSPVAQQTHGHCEEDLIH